MFDVSELSALDLVQSEAHDLSFVVEFRLNNVGAGSWEDEDWVAGDYEIAGNGSSFTKDASALYFSDKYVLHGPSGLYRAVAGSLFYVSRANLPFDQAPYPNFGGLSIVCDAKDPIENIYARRWESGEFKIKVGGIMNVGLQGEVELEYSEYKTLMTGSTKSATWGVKSISPTLAPEKNMDIAFPPHTFAGTGASEGGAELKGKPKPFMLGKPNNVTPVHLGGGVYMYFDPNIARAQKDGLTPTYVIPEPAVRSDGVPLSANNMLPSTATNGQIFAAAVPDGEFVYNNSIIKVGGEVGLVTIDATGMWDTETSMSDGEFNVECRSYLLSGVKRLIEALADIPVVFGDNVPFETVSVNPHIGDIDLFGEESGVFVDEKTTLRKFVTGLLSSAGYLMLEELDGSLLIKKREPLNGDVVKGIILNKNIVPASQQDNGVVDHVSKYRVMYRKNWSVQSPESLNLTNQSQYSVDGLWAEQINFNQSGFSNFDDALSVESPFLTEASAQALADTIFKYGRYARKCTFQAVNEKWKYKGGDMIKAELDIYPAGTIYELIEVEEQMSANMTRFGAIAYV